MKEGRQAGRKEGGMFWGEGGTEEKEPHTTSTPTVGSKNANRCRFHCRLEQLESRLVLSFSQVGAMGSFGDGKAAWVDFDQDGWTDLASGGTLYHNYNGTLTSFTSASGDGVWGDYDNDGYPDLYSYSNRVFKRNNQGMNLITASDSTAIRAALAIF